MAHGTTLRCALVSKFRQDLVNRSDNLCWVAITCSSVCTPGALSRGDAKVLLMGGQDDIWDHAAGILIAQESGFLVMNGAGTS